MDHQTGRLVGLLLAVCMALTLSACGKKDPAADGGSPADASGASGGSASVQEPVVPEYGHEPDPDTLIDPGGMEWGYDSPDSSDPQHWYPDGDKLSGYYLMFEDDCVTVNDGGDRTTFFTAVADGHIVNWSEDDPAMDFVFTDDLTCYDLVNEQWYLRADYDAVMDSLTASTFYCEAGDQWNITFHDDGTYSYERDGELVEGEWWLRDANTIHYADDYGETWFRITYAGDSWEVLRIEDTDVFYPRA